MFARRTLLRVGAIVAGLLAAEVGWARFPWSVEGAYVAALGPALQRALTWVSAPLPLSLAELVEVAALALAAGWLVAVMRRARVRADRREVALDALLTAAVAVGTVGVVFYAVWGLAYARPSAAERLGWASNARPLAPIGAPELAELAERLVERTNDAYLRLHGAIDAGAPSAAPEGLGALDLAIDQGYARLAAAEGLDPDLGRSRGRAKQLGTSVVFSYLGIGGFYFPFTGEANVNALEPEWQLAQTIAHEKAHQRFVASEDEANFFGFLAGVYADDPFATYGAWLFAQRQVLFALGEVDPYGAAQVLARRLPGVQRDVDFSRAFWRRYQGPAQQASQAVNDRYLKFNGVRGGVQSYSLSVTLIVEWLRRNPDQIPPAT